MKKYYATDNKSGDLETEFTNIEEAIELVDEWEAEDALFDQYEPGCYSVIEEDSNGTREVVYEGCPESDMEQLVKVIHGRTVGCHWMYCGVDIQPIVDFFWLEDHVEQENVEAVAYSIAMDLYRKSVNYDWSKYDVSGEIEDFERNRQELSYINDLD